MQLENGAILTVYPVSHLLIKHQKKEKQQRIEKPVKQLDLNGNLIRSYSSINQAYVETKIEHISQCANGLRKTARGYNWEFEKD